MANQVNKLGGLITRKDFIRYSVISSFFLCIPVFLKKPFSLKTKQLYFIKPISGISYKPSFLAFCKRAKFASARQAIASVKDPHIPYTIGYET